MTLDSSVMNVSIRQVAADIGTTVTGIQTAITVYTLVMASLMITCSKIGAILGRRRAYHRGCPDHAGDRGSGRGQLPQRAPVSGLRADRGGQRHRRGSRPADRRGRHQIRPTWEPRSARPWSAPS
jgi:hypothetical protein